MFFEPLKGLEPLVFVFLFTKQVLSPLSHKGISEENRNRTNFNCAELSVPYIQLNRTAYNPNQLFYQINYLNKTMNNKKA